MRTLLISFLLFLACSALKKKSPIKMSRQTKLPPAVIVVEKPISRTPTDCDAKCPGGRMTLACCECIGCHQGMRFGKRSAPLSLYDVAFEEPMQPMFRVVDIDENDALLIPVRQERARWVAL
ncbi:unnamed protein product, partial [Mesorhabditis belari]|uniref:Uncharacterized protein n=1 Tax=Mesorhabditis belari TaxID=2138241 RepID=A0AAF3JAQ7_9BILA